VRSAPHFFADVANSSQADHDWRASSACALPFGRYFLNRSRYCWVGGFLSASKNGTNADWMKHVLDRRTAEVDQPLVVVVGRRGDPLQLVPDVGERLEQQHEVLGLAGPYEALRLLGLQRLRERRPARLTGCVVLGLIDVREAELLARFLELLVHGDRGRDVAGHVADVGDRVGELLLDVDHRRVAQRVEGVRQRLHLQVRAAGLLR